MVIFKNKFLFKLIASICLFLTLLNFGLTNRAFATGSDDEDEVWGGPLVKPIMNLFTGIGDGIMDILHNAVLKQDATLIKIDTSNNKATIWGVIAGIVVLAVTAVIIGATGGVAAFAGVGLAKIVAGTYFVIKTAAYATAIGAGAGIAVGVLINGANMSKNLYLPVFKLTSEEIFANRVWLFDVNFFKPGTYHIVQPKYQGAKTLYTDEDFIKDLCIDAYKAKDKYDEWNLEDFYNEENTDSFEMIRVMVKDISNLFSEDAITEEGKDWKIRFGNCKGTEQGDIDAGIVEIDLFKSDKSMFFKIQGDYDRMIDGDDEVTCKWTSNITEKEEILSTAARLQKIVSTWYFILRNLALLVLMIVLIYTGIRIVIGSTAGEKAKYKERLMDWIVALCLVFIMHYIMAFAVEITEKITELVDTVGGTNMISRIIKLTPKQKDVVNENKDGIKDKLAEYIIEENDEMYIIWGTNLAGGMRVDMQQVNEGTANWLGYGICYVILVMYTLFFSWTYLKRVLYMAFLTITAPLVAMTYPVDKITDGKAQAFNQWLKEYIFNLLIQPVHLLLYTILVSAAYQLAAENPLYAIVAIGFMLPAEKLLRKFFGFDKAKTPGLLGGAAGAALAFTGLQKFMGHGAKDKGGMSKGEREAEHKDSNKLKFSSSQAVSPGEVIAGAYANVEGEGDNIPYAVNPEGGNIPYDVDSEGQLFLPGFEGGASKPTYEEGSKTGARGLGYGGVSKKASNSFADASGIEPPRKLQKKHSIPRTLLAAGGAYGRGLGKKLTRRVNNARPIRALARGVAGAYGAVALGMAGAMLGVSSGDPSKAFQYATAGVAGGYSMGKGIGGRTVDALTVDSGEIKDAMEMTWAGDEYKKRKIEEEKRQLKRNEEYINYLRKTMGVSRKGAQEILEKTGDSCLDAGITEIEDIATIDQMTRQMTHREKEELERQMKEEREQRIVDGNPMTEWEIQLQKERFERRQREIEQEAMKHSISMKKFSDRTPDFTKLGKNKLDAYEKRFTAELHEEIKKQLIAQGVSEEKAESLATQRAPNASKIVMRGIAEFDETKATIKKA